MGEYVWLIVGVIAVVAISKIIYQIYKKNTGERGAYRQTAESSSNSNSQLPSNPNEFGPAITKRIGGFSSCTGKLMASGLLISCVCRA